MVVTGAARMDSWKSDVSESGVRGVVLALVALIALLQTAAIEAQGTNPPYLGQMPPVERVLRDIRGADSIDTAARQAGVFWQLQGVIRNLARSQHRTDRQFTPDETRLSSEYRNAYYSVWLPVQNALAQDRPRLFKLEGYTTNGDLLAEALERLSSPAFRAEYDEAVGQVDARVQARKVADPVMAKPATGAKPSDAGSQPCPVTGAPGAAKPGARGNSSLSVYGGYRLTFTDQYGNVTHQKSGNFADTTLYLVDSDVEKVLQAAGVEPTWSDSRVEAVAFYDAFSEVGMAGSTRSRARLVQGEWSGISRWK